MPAATNIPIEWQCHACDYSWYAHERTPCPRCHPEHCPDCTLYDLPHTPRCKSHPDYDGPEAP